MPSGGLFDSNLLESRPGFVSVLFEGKGAKKIFGNEAGGHRFQRISPTEKRGRVHTSTITVAVLDASSVPEFKLNEQEIEITTTKGTGPGGQHRNTTDSCVIAKHVPTGVSVRIDCRSQHQSRALALRILAERISQDQQRNWDAKRAAERKKQLGTGQRGDKVRTYRERDDRVVDHRSGQKWKLTKWMRGDW